MKRLALSTAAALALTMGLAGAASAYDWTTLGVANNDVYAATTRLPLVNINDCTGACDGSCNNGCNLDCDDCCDCIGNWHDNTLIFAASDAWGNAGDFSLKNNFGYRTGFNTGLAIIEGSPIRAQIGASIGVYDLKGNDTRFTNTNQAETQIFVTGGIYKRSDICAGDPLAWGVVLDYMNDNNYGIFNLSSPNVAQIRSIIGYAWDEANEFGVWSAFRAQSDVVFPGGAPLRIRAQDQVNGFWHHNWDFGGDTTIYTGWADDPGTWTFGGFGQVPLNDNVALFGSTNYIAPVNGNNVFGQIHETWNVSFGIVYYFGGKASNPTVSGYQGLPLLNVADNGTFAIQGPI